MAAVVTQRSAAAVLTLGQIKQQCNIDLDMTDDDELLTLMERAAVRACEGKLKGPLLTASYRETFGQWPLIPSLLLQTANAKSVQSIMLRQAGQVVEWRDFVALEDGPHLFIRPRAAWPKIDAAPDAIQITYMAGFGAAGDRVPEDIQQWLLYRVGTFYEFREQFIAGTIVTDLPKSFVDEMLTPYTMQVVAL